MLLRCLHAPALAPHPPTHPPTCMCDGDLSTLCRGPQPAPSHLITQAMALQSVKLPSTTDPQVVPTLISHQALALAAATAACTAPHPFRAWISAAKIIANDIDWPAVVGSWSAGQRRHMRAGRCDQSDHPVLWLSISSRQLPAHSRPAGAPANTYLVCEADVAHRQPPNFSQVSSIPARWHAQGEQE